MKNVLILEDKDVHAKRLELLVLQVNNQVNVIISHNDADAYVHAMEKDIDLFLIDIILDSSKSQDISGLKFVDNIRQLPKYKFVPVIFVTSMYDPKMYTYTDLHCYSFIEKPYNDEKVKTIIKDALEYKNFEVSDKKIYFRIEGIIYAFHADDIIYIEVINRKVFLHTKDGIEEMSYIPCGKILQNINNKKFIQCSRQCIINTEHIKTIDKVNRYITLDETDDIIEIGKTYRKKFLAGIKNDL